MVDLEKLQELYDAAGSCDEIDEAIADELPAIIAELTALRAKVAAGRKLREACGDMDEISDALAEYDAAAGVE